MTAPVAVGDVLEDKYRVERVIGAGGMGMVVAATHLELGQLVAMKFLLAEGLGNPEVAARFMREARAVARIRSEHVARVVDVGRLPSGAPYIVMEYLEGSDLDAYLQHGRLGVEEATDYVIQACDAMAAAHRLGIVHRDLKPANLFLTRRLDGSPIVKVLDFGISKSVLDTGAGALTNAGALVGSPLYMSPEQMRSAKDVDLRTDIWSLGAVLFELLAGRPPFLGDSIPALVAEITLSPPASLAELRPDLPEGVVAVVTRCLEKDRADRFPDVAELARALAPFAPQAAQLAVERVFRIVGSVPPPAPLTTPPVPRSSSSVALGGPLSQGAPLSLPRPPSLGSLGVAATASAPPLGQGTAPGWTGTGAPRPPTTRRGTLVLALAGLGMLIAGGAALALGARRTPAQPEHAAAPEAKAPLASAEPRAVPVSSTLEPSKEPERVAVTPALVSAAPAVASAAAAPIKPANPRRKAQSAGVASAAPATATEEPKKTGLSMKIK